MGLAVAACFLFNLLLARHPAACFPLRAPPVPACVQRTNRVPVLREEVENHRLWAGFPTETFCRVAGAPCWTCAAEGSHLRGDVRFPSGENGPPETKGSFPPDQLEGFLFVPSNLRFLCGQQALSLDLGTAGEIVLFS